MYFNVCGAPVHPLSKSSFAGTDLQTCTKLTSLPKGKNRQVSRNSTQRNYLKKRQSYLCTCSLGIAILHKYPAGQCASFWEPWLSKLCKQLLKGSIPSSQLMLYTWCLTPRWSLKPGLQDVGEMADDIFMLSFCAAHSCPQRGCMVSRP